MDIQPLEKWSRVHSIFKKSWGSFRNNFWKFLIVDALFLLFSSALFIFARGRIMVMLAQINQYAGDLSVLQQQLQANVSALSSLDSILGVIEPMAAKLNAFVFFLVPFLFLAIWSLLQHMQYSLVLKKKWFDASFLVKTFLYTIVPFALAVYCLNKIIVLLSWAGPTAFILFWVFVAFISLYLATLSYHLLNEKPMQGLRKLVYLILTRSHLLLPLFFVYSLVWLILLFLMANILILYIAGGAYLSLATVVTAVAGLLLVGFLRVLLEKASEVVRH